MTGAKRATHVSVSPPVPSFQKYSRHSKPRVMCVSANSYLPIMDNAHEVEYDESNWTRIYSVAQNPTRPKNPRLFKHDFESAESREGRTRVGSACINCAGEDHFLRACTREYINHYGLFSDEFGAGTPTEVRDRWVYTRGRIKAKYLQIRATHAKEAIEKRIKAKLANKWTGPDKILGVGPCRVGQRFVGPKLLHLDMPFKNMANPRVSVLRCKRCFQPHEKENKRLFMPWQLSSYVMNKFSELAPPFYLTTNDVNIELDTHNVPNR